MAFTDKLKEAICKLKPDHCIWYDDWNLCDCSKPENINNKEWLWRTCEKELSCTFDDRVKQ